MVRRWLVVMGLIAVAMSAPAWAEDAASTAQVTIDNFSFTPPVLTVTAGTRVTWTNRDDIPHTVVSRENPAAMRSPVLDTDDQFSLTFDKAGTYGFFCTLHPHMQGTVVVQ